MAHLQLKPTRELVPRQTLRVPANAESLAQQMRQGWPARLPPILVTDDAVVIDGHHRLAAAQAASLPQVPTLVVPAASVWYSVHHQGLSPLRAALAWLDRPANRWAQPYLAGNAHRHP